MMIPTTSITQLVSAYWVFSTIVYVDNISSIMYVVQQSYCYCGNRNLKFWLVCFWNLHNKCYIRIENFFIEFTEIKFIYSRYCLNLWKKYFINIPQGITIKWDQSPFYFIESAPLLHCHISCLSAYTYMCTCYINKKWKSFGS